MTRIAPVISLTSIPPRFGGIGPVLDGLAGQGLEVNLWIPETYRRFPDWDGVMPNVPKGVRIRRCKTDFGPATKIIPVLRERHDAPVLICDDDVLYRPGWAKAFLAAYEGDTAIAGSVFDVARLGVGQDATSPAEQRRICQGFAGILLNGAMLASHRIRERDIFVDDIWISAMLTAKGTPIVCRPEIRDFVQPQTAGASLQDALINGRSRAQMNKQTAQELAREFAIWGA